VPEGAGTLRPAGSDDDETTGERIPAELAVRRTGIRCH